MRDAGLDNLAVDMSKHFSKFQEHFGEVEFSDCISSIIGTKLMFSSSLEHCSAE